jgi:hypothetical protein
MLESAVFTCAVKAKKSALLFDINQETAPPLVTALPVLLCKRDTREKYSSEHSFGKVTSLLDFPSSLFL